MPEKITTMTNLKLLKGAVVVDVIERMGALGYYEPYVQQVIVEKDGIRYIIETLGFHDEYLVIQKEPL